MPSDLPPLPEAMETLSKLARRLESAAFSQGMVDMEEYPSDRKLKKYSDATDLARENLLIAIESYFRAFGHACRVVDEDAVAEVLERLEGWAKAYPVGMFHEPTQEERDWLHATKPGLMDCIAASMGRHIASCIASDIAKLRAAIGEGRG